MTQIILSEQTKTAMLAYAANPNTPIQCRMLDSEYWMDMTVNNCFHPTKMEYRVAPSAPHPHADAIRAFVAAPNNTITHLYEDRTSWGLTDKNIAVTFWPDVKYRHATPSGNTITEFKATK